MWQKREREYPVGFILICSIVFFVSVAATIYLSVSMSGGMTMPGGWTMSMMWMRMMDQTWIESAAMFLLMWEVMMIAMMLPSALPMFLSYYKAQYNEGVTCSGMSTLIVASGYFFVWLLIGVAVYVVGVLFAMAAMQSPGLSHAVPILSGLALIIAGTIQFTGWKMRGLRRCRNRQMIPTTQTFGIYRSAWHGGLSEGLCCARASSGPMFILLILGAMNLIVMAIVALMIAMEKLLPKPDFIVRISGCAAIGTGLFIIGRLFF